MSTISPLRPLCFMVMPFGRKVVVPPAENGVAEIDFDALWTKAFEPVIRELGYDPVRADQDVGALIIHEMLERLYFSDLVMADLTIPNGNVYYEIGIRHASQQRGCLLVSAEWAKPLFDANQMRRLTYPMAEGVITDATAAAISSRLKEGAARLAEGKSPVYEVLPGFPSNVNPERASSIRDRLRDLSAFQARVREARLALEPARAAALARTILTDFPPSAPLSPSIALELMTLVRDCIGWAEMVTYVDALPARLRDLDTVQEQRALARSKSGNHLEAIAALEELIRHRGDTSERQGLVGGRYKKLAAANRESNPTAYRTYLDQAIDHYERGMAVDINDYYPTSNLARLYRERNEDGDDARARFSSRLTQLACQRTLDRNPSDEWVRPTLLGVAFDERDLAAATRCLRDVQREGAAKWKLETTIRDLERSVQQISDAGRQQEFSALLDRLKATQ